MREAADSSIAARGTLEIEERESVRAGAVRRDAEVLEQRIADEVRRPAGGRPGSDVYAWLAEIGWQKLRVDVGEVQQRNVAEWRHVVEFGAGLGIARSGAQRRARGGGEGEEAEEFPPLQFTCSPAVVSRWAFSPAPA